MARTRIWRLLQGYRGKPACDIDTVAQVLIRVGQLAADHAAIAELDINPLVADTADVIALDARIAVVRPSLPGAARLSICPYPSDLESIGELPDGTRVKLRPVRPDDEALLRDIFAHMTPTDIRSRFFTAVRQVGPELSARLAQIDYDREIGLIALQEGPGTALGVARFSADPDNRRAEFAITVRSDWKRGGLGRLLLTHLSEVARRRGIGEAIGKVGRNNPAMLALCRSLGLKIVADPADPACCT